MILLDTNVLIYASDERSPHRTWDQAVPLPDFFIGAHAEIMGWTLATADVDRYKAYFPKVRLKIP